MNKTQSPIKSLCETGVTPKAYREVSFNLPRDTFARMQRILATLKPKTLTEILRGLVEAWLETEERRVIEVSRPPKSASQPSKKFDTPNNCLNCGANRAKTCWDCINHRRWIPEDEERQGASD